ncbi:MAG: amidohydrolase [Anaerolineales bacterium]|nr:MAG: amidohydrolase [Anaerolineales bacterium]
MLNQAKELQTKLTEYRRDFHMHPELGFNEYRTSAKVAEVLRSLGLRVKEKVGKTGVVGEIGQGLPIVAIRADMDALPLQEDNKTAYTSQYPGVMHACGHDAHTAILLGVAEILSKEENLPGTVRLLFQPAEEVADDEGISGAPRMIEDGAMQGGVGLTLALHVSAHVPVGQIQVGAGPSSGGVDTFRGSIIGMGGHGARPHETVDPIYLSAYVILALHGIVSRRLNPFDPAVVTIGSIHAGNAENVIPNQVDILGTIRYMEHKVQEQIHREIKKAFDVAKSLGGDYSLKFEIGTPPMINDEKAVELIKATATDLIGSENILPPQDGLGAEDFGCFSELAPGAMFVLGSKVEGDEREHHNSHFDVNDECLPYGVAILADSALRFMRKGGF